ncbi:MAG: PF20097 family protein [Akkermansiaceae bacterium]
MEDDHPNPYEAPTTDVGKPRTDDPPCPQCGNPMESGHLLSSTSVRWVGNDESFLRKNVLGGKAIPARNTTFGGRYHGTCCWDCQIYQLAKT